MLLYPDCFTVVAFGFGENSLISRKVVFFTSLTQHFSLSSFLQLTHVHYTQNLQYTRISLRFKVEDTQMFQVGLKIIEDVANCWWQILVGLGVAMLICIIYIVLMRWIAAVMVWLSILGVIALLSFCKFLRCYLLRSYREKSNLLL